MAPGFASSVCVRPNVSYLLACVIAGPPMVLNTFYVSAGSSAGYSSLFTSSRSLFIVVVPPFSCSAASSTIGSAISGLNSLFLGDILDFFRCLRYFCS